MNIEITPQTLVGSVNAVASKSHAHRLLIAAALSKRPAEVSIRTTSQDIEATRLPEAAQGRHTGSGLR